MNLLFINCVCSNSGDAAIFQAAAAVMRSAFGPDIEIVIQDDHPLRVRKLYPSFKVRSSCYWKLAYTEHRGWRGRLLRGLRFGRFHLVCWLKRHGAYRLGKPFLGDIERDYLDAFDWADIVVATGGTYLVEHYDLGQRIFDMGTAIALRRPLVLFTQSAGPFKSTANRRRLGHIIRKARLTLLRDERSRTHIRELSVRDEDLRLAPDAAFALADGDLAKRPIDPVPLAKPRPKIALSVRQWSYFTNCSNQEGMERYCAAFAELTAHLVERYNAEVTFLSTCQGVAGYHDDSRVAAAIVAKLPEDVRCRVAVDGEFHAPHELIDRLRGFDWVVSTRMHLAILALGVGAPVLPIAYEFKTIDLFRGLNYGHDILTIETLTSDSLVDAFEKSVEAYGRVAYGIHEAVDQSRQRAWQIADALRDKFPEFAPALHRGNSRVENTREVSKDQLPVQ